MKVYEVPEVHVTAFTAEPILDASGDWTDGLGGDGNIGGEKYD